MLEEITTACFVPVKMTKQKSLVFCGQVFAQTTETNININKYNHIVPLITR